jgi:hypothetical protein
MNVATVTTSASVGGVNTSSVISRSAEGQIGQDVVLPAGVDGAISATAGVDGLPVGHGFVQTDTVAVHWTENGILKCCYALRVDSATETSVELSGGLGDDLPAEDTNVILSLQKSIEVDWDGTKTEVFVASSVQSSHFAVCWVGGNFPVSIPENGGFCYISNNGWTNPFNLHAITNIVASNASTTETTIKIGVLYDSVP